MALTPYPLPRSIRQVAVFLGNGGTVYGPFGDGWGIFDIEDVVVKTRLAGQGFATVTPVIAKVDPLQAYGPFTVTFAAPVLATTQILVKGSRTHERSVAITRGGAIDGVALEKELSKQAVVLQEQRRDTIDALSIAEVERLAETLIGFDSGVDLTLFALRELLNGSFDAKGSFAGRSAFDTEAPGFTYLDIDSSPMVYYMRVSVVPGQWLGPFHHGFRLAGAAGVDVLGLETDDEIAAYLDEAYPFSLIVPNDARLAALEAGSGVPSIVRETWLGAAGLVSVVPVLGQNAEVLQTDTGTHLDPVISPPGTVTVNNKGRYTGYTSPLGWKHISDDPYQPFERVGKVGYGETTHGLPLLMDKDGKAIASVDPIAGPVILRNHRPSVGTMRGIYMAGQSNNAVGSTNVDSIPAIHTAAMFPDNFWMYKHWVLIGMQDQVFGAGDNRQIVAAREGGAAWDIGSNNETYTTGMIAEIYSYMTARAMAMPPYLIINTARSGASINAINKGTVPFQNMLDSAADATRKFPGFTVDCIIPDIGETDDTKSLAVMKALLQTYYDDLNSTVDGLRFVTGQADAIPMYFNQVPTLQVFGSGQGGQDALLSLHYEALASEAARRMFLLNPRYDAGYSSNLHVKGVWKPRIGARMGWSLMRQKYDLAYVAGAAVPLSGNGVFKMLTAVKTGTLIGITTDAQYPLEFFTTPAGDPGDKGFVIEDTAAPLTITAINQNANATITYTGTDPVNGQTWWVTNTILGMTEMNNRKVVIAALNVGAKTFQTGVDSSAFTAYASGGGLLRQKAITSVIVAGTGIQIDCASLAVGDRLSYARKGVNLTGTGPGGWGLVRDTNPKTSALVETVSLKMPMMACEITVT